MIHTPTVPLSRIERGVSRAVPAGWFSSPPAPQQESPHDASHATLLWSIWQALLKPFAWAFTRFGFRRFAEWVTALAINPEEHTITQSVTALDRIADGKALETYTESGAWRTDDVTDSLTRLVETAPGSAVIAPFSPRSRP